MIDTFDLAFTAVQLVGGTDPETRAFPRVRVGVEVPDLAADLDRTDLPATPTGRR